MVLWVTMVEPLVTVPVTVSVYVPAGVPTACGGGTSGLLLPPQPGIELAASNATDKTADANPSRRGTNPSSCSRRRHAMYMATLKVRASHNTMRDGIRMPGGCNGVRGAAIPRAVVVTVDIAFTNVVPLIARLEGATLQVASDGAPVHVRERVPVNPGVPLNARL